MLAGDKKKCNPALPVILHQETLRFTIVCHITHVLASSDFSQQQNILRIELPWPLSGNSIYNTIPLLKKENVHWQKIWPKIFVRMNSDQLVKAKSTIDDYFAESVSVPVKLEANDKRYTELTTCQTFAPSCIQFQSLIIEKEWGVLDSVFFFSSPYFKFSVVLK